MKTQAILCALFVLALFVCQAGIAQQPALLPPLAEDADGKDLPKQKEKEKDKDKKTDKKLTEPPKTDLFNLTPMGSQFPTGFNPQMMGDFPGVFVRRTINLAGMRTTTVTTRQDIGNGVIVVTVNQKSTPVFQTVTVRVPFPSAAAFKIAENASPRPVDRVFFTYNYFSDIRDPQRGATNAVNTNQTSVFTAPGLTVATDVNTSFPGLPRAGANLHREVFGFEKTFLNGFASVELRVPLLQQSANIDGFSARDIGDITVIGKYAFLLDPNTGNVFSAGLAVTAPTGSGIDLGDGALHSTLLQPWFGYIWNSERFFLHAFHSVVVPTDSRDVTLLFNDVGLNYWLYRAEPNRFINFLVPMVEAHITTPLNHRNGEGPIYVPDLVVLTGGVHVGLFGNGTLSLGVATPVSGPRVFSVEAFAQFNWRF